MSAATRSRPRGAFATYGRHYYWKSHKLGPLTDKLIDVVVDQTARVTSPLSAVPILSLGGAVAGAIPPA